jgi:hypothetical protein
MIWSKQSLKFLFVSAIHVTEGDTAGNLQPSKVFFSKAVGINLRESRTR